MSLVTAVRTNDWKKDDGTVTKVTNVTFDDGQEVPGYDLPTEPEIGKPLPDGWEVATSARGKPYIKVPKAGGGRGGGAPAAFRNTRDGFIAEQESIHRSVALDKALTFHGMKVEPPSIDDLLKTATKLYAWLSNPSQGSHASGGSAASTSTHSGGQSPSSSRAPKDEGGSTGGKKAQNHTQPKAVSASPDGAEELGEGSEASSGVCAHENVTLSKPDGKPLPNGFYRCSDCGHVGRIL